MKAVILPTVAEQVAAGEDAIIDPEKLIFEEDGKGGPVFFEGRYDSDNIVGWWRNMRIEEGQLVADIELRAGPASKVNHFSPAAMRGTDMEARLIAVHGAYAPCKDEG